MYSQTRRTEYAQLNSATIDKKFVLHSFQSANFHCPFARYTSELLYNSDSLLFTCLRFINGTTEVEK